MNPGNHQPPWHHGRYRFGRGLLLLILGGVVLVGCVVSAVRHGGGDKCTVAASPRVEAPPGVAAFELTSPSEVTLNGMTNVNAWTCRTTNVQATVAAAMDASTLDAMFDRIEGGGKVDFPASVLVLAPRSKLELKVPVKSLKGSSPGMDHDMQVALKADQHPAIQFALEEIQRVHATHDNAHPALAVRVKGRLNVAGVWRQTILDATVRRPSRGKFSTHASSKMLMTDFGVKPPTAFFGLVSAQDSLCVTFDLNFVLASEKHAGD